VSPSHPNIAKLPPIEAFSQLENTICKRSQIFLSDKKPLVLLEFDEAYTMTKLQHTETFNWSNFHVVQRVLRTMKESLVFSVFLSTTGKISEFVPSKQKDPSNRINAGELKLIQPYTDLGFDQFAKRISKISSENQTLKYITSDEHIAHYGRPMYVYLS